MTAAELSKAPKGCVVRMELENGLTLDGYSVGVYTYSPTYGVLPGIMTDKLPCWPIVGFYHKYIKSITRLTLVDGTWKEEK